MLVGGGMVALTMMLCGGSVRLGSRLVCVCRFGMARVWHDVPRMFFPVRPGTLNACYRALVSRLLQRARWKRQGRQVEICRLFNVSPPIVQDCANNTFTNAAQANLWFASNTLAPIARKFEAEFSRSVFTGSAYHVEIDLSRLLRGDSATRWTANVAAVGAGILTGNEVRAQEGYGPMPAAAN